MISNEELQHFAGNVEIDWLLSWPYSPVLNSLIELLFESVKKSLQSKKILFQNVLNYKLLFAKSRV